MKNRLLNFLLDLLAVASFVLLIINIHNDGSRINKSVIIDLVLISILVTIIIINYFTHFKPLRLLKYLLYFLCFINAILAFEMALNVFVNHSNRFSVILIANILCSICPLIMVIIHAVVDMIRSFKNIIIFNYRKATKIINMIWLVAVMLLFVINVLLNINEIKHSMGLTIGSGISILVAFVLSLLVFLDKIKNSNVLNIIYSINLSFILYFNSYLLIKYIVPASKVYIAIIGILTGIVLVAYVLFIITCQLLYSFKTKNVGSMEQL